MANTEGEKYSINAEVNAQLLAYYQNATEDIRLAKRQQWHIAYYTILLYSAVILSSRYITKPWDKWTFAILVALLVGILVGSIAGLFRMQAWMASPRNLARDIEGKMSPMLKRITGWRDEPVPLLHRPEITWLLSAVSVVAFVVAIWLLVEISPTIS